MSLYCCFIILNITIPNKHINGKVKNSLYKYYIDIVIDWLRRKYYDLRIN